MKEFFVAKKVLHEIAEVAPQTIWRKLTELGFASAKENSGQHVSVFAAREVLKFYIASKKNPSMKVQTFFNFKGGTGKTTLTFNISALFYLMGYKILVIDCDPQAHLTRSVCGELDDGYSLYDVVTGEKSLDNVIRSPLPDYSVIPSSIKLTFLESILQNKVNREKTLSKILDPVKSNYDFIFIDVNPSINQLNRNAIVASNVINIVSEAQPYSFYGMEILLQEFRQLSELSVDNEVNFKVILNKVEPRSSINISIANALQSTPGLQNNLVDHIVRKSEDFNVSAKDSIPVIGLRNRNSSNAKSDIIGLAKELLELSTVPNVNGGTNAA